MSQDNRSQRRRQNRGDPPDAGLFGRREIVGVLVLGAGLAGVLVGLALFAGGGDDASAPAVTQAPTPLPVFSPSTSDELAIAALARRSIEVLPRGEWPSLYDDFAPDFQERCTRQDFEQGGQTNVQELGTNLPLLAYKNLSELTISGDTATAVVVGELIGLSEYSVRAGFQRVDGAWKLAPVEQTEGCQAFTRLSG